MPKPWQKPPAGPPPVPQTAEEGALHIRAHLIATFDRRNGTGVDWPLVAESLFRAAFQVMATLPEGDSRAIACRVQITAYERFIASVTPALQAPEAAHNSSPASPAPALRLRP